MHSKRKLVSIVLLCLEVLVFGAAFLLTYFSAEAEWEYFWWGVAVVILAFCIIKAFQTFPELKDILAFDDAASKIYRNAVRIGVVEYFNMRDPEGQRGRNEATQRAIDKAGSMWLCANSGASYLEPAVYRHWDFVEKSLKNGAEFKVVLLDPDSDEKKFRDRLNIGVEDSNSKINYEGLRRNLKKYRGLEVRFIKTGMHSTIFATEDSMFFDPYQVAVINERIDNRTFSLRINKLDGSEDSGLYKIFKANFNTLWREGKTFDEWYAERKRKAIENR